MFQTPDANVDSRHLRILVITSTYPRSDGDYAVPWLRESLSRLAARGHEVTVLAPSYRGLRSHEIDGIPVHRFRYWPRRWESLTHEEGATNKIPVVNPLFQLLGVPYIAKGSLASGRLAARRRFDVIHSHWPFPHGIMAATARLFGSAPVVANCHGAEFALARRKSWVRPVLRWALRSSEMVVCNSSHTAQEIRALSGREARIIPYGSTVRGRPTALPLNDVSKILFTGRLIERKGVEYLIAAMPLILARGRLSFRLLGMATGARTWSDSRTPSACRIPCSSWDSSAMSDWTSSTRIATSTSTHPSSTSAATPRVLVSVLSRRSPMADR